jgi:hypothetical protein
MFLTCDMSMQPAQVSLSPAGFRPEEGPLQNYGFVTAGHVVDAITNPDKPRGWRIQWHRIGGQNT